MAPWPAFVALGAVLGALSGLFGVGGSSLATPALSLLGVPGLMAVASPLPATLPTALTAAWPYLRQRNIRPRAALWSLLGAVPAAVIGAMLAHLVGGDALLIASGVVLVVVGIRVLRPVSDRAHRVGEARRKNRPTLVAVSAGVGLFTGLLANGGGFLLVPMFLLLFGLTMTQASGTSLAVVAVLAIPATAAHWALGHIDWSVAAAVALGAAPTSAVTATWAQRVTATRLQAAFGWFLIVSGAAFTLYRLVI
ncbi:sulfite exporter TauE/SafE family protein [Mycobacterium interjectum]|uniref:sulfite exporter TauE/SafE family protein n=1 Tax=Mycobacterium interjectum TaxID=33895 RepID=UPI000833270D|nr:sulfite exporter TauE/SafE family protein [Mycobacterium interjectum]MCV7093220.1 sulfite exporter TauE/SafE family protein [Mycobacterium interjectum]